MYQTWNLPIGPPTAGSKRARPEQAPVSPVFKVPFRVLEAYAITLGHQDVTANLVKNLKCEECDAPQYLPDGTLNPDLWRCDGGFPMLVGQAFPVDAYGRQHECHRGTICETCVYKKPRDRKGYWTIRHQGIAEEVLGLHEMLRQPNVKMANIYFLCGACSNGTSDHMEAWSTGVVDAKSGLRPGCIHPTTAPVATATSEVSVADRVDRERLLRTERVAAAAIQFARYGGISVVHAAGAFVRVVRGLFMPRTQQQAVLHVIHELCADGVLRPATTDFPGDVGDSRVSAILPKDLRTLEHRAASIMSTADDVSYTQVRIGLQSLQQTQPECHVLINDLEACIQSLLLDPRFPPTERYFRPNTERREYTTETGEVVHGPEVWHGEQWQDAEDTISPGSRLLGLIVHSDETASLRGSRYPFRLRIGNMAMKNSRADWANRLIGLGPIINIHRQRGSKAHVDLNDAQSACKNSVFAVTPAHILADLNEVVKRMSTFNVWYPEEDGFGGERRLSVEVRIVMITADFEEKKSLVAFAGAGCPRCHFYEHAMSKEESAGRTHKDARPYMRNSFGSNCGTATKRTTMTVTSKQVCP